jgi:hypothetical protein
MGDKMQRGATASHSFQRARQREQGRVVHKEQLIKTETIGTE